jgi:hypothetical protein
VARFGGAIDDNAGFFGGGNSIGGDPLDDDDLIGTQAMNDSQVLHFVMVEGWSQIFCTILPTSYSWTAPSGRSYVKGLRHPGRYTQTINTTGAVADEEIPDLVLDDVDGTVTSLLAVSASGDWYAEILGGPTAYTNLLPADTTATLKQLYGTIPSSGTAFVGLECVSYSLTSQSQGLPALTLTRGLYPAIGDARGRLHRVDAARLQYPRVSSKATTHVGRLVAMYEVSYDSQGNPMPASTARVMWTGVLGAPRYTSRKGEGSYYSFPVTSIPQYLRGGGATIGARGALHAQPFRAAIGGDASTGRIGAWAVDGGGAGGAGSLTTGTAAAAFVIYYDSTLNASLGARIDVDLTEVINPTGARATMTPAQRLVYAVNQELMDAAVVPTTKGIWRLGWSEVANGSVAYTLTLTVQQGTAASPPSSSSPPLLVFYAGSEMGSMLGFTGGSEYAANAPLGVRASRRLELDVSGGNGSITGDVPPIDTLFYMSTGQTLTGTAAVSLPVAPSTAAGVLSTQPDMPTATDGSTRPYVWLLVDNQIILGGAPPTSSWSSQTINSLTFSCDRRIDVLDGGRLTGDSPGATKAFRRYGDRKPLVVEQVWVPMGAGGNTSDTFGPTIDPPEMLLRSLLSTGSMGYNSATYDVLPAAWSLGLPAALVDVDSFTALRSRAAVALVRRFVFRKPVAFMDLLEEELRFLGARLVMRNGRMTVVEPTLPATDGRTVSLYGADIALTLDASNTGTIERPSHSRGSSVGISLASVKVDFDVVQDRYREPTLELAIAGALGEGSTGKIELRSRGVTREAIGEAPLRQALTAVIASTWARYAREAQIVTRGISWPLRRIYPGQRCFLTDQSVPSMYTGTIGLTDAAAEVLRVSYDYQSRTGEVDLYLYPMGATAAGGPTVRDVADSASLDSRRSDKGYDSGNSKLYVLADRDPSVPGALVPFAVDDVITVREIDPADPANPLSWTVTVTARDDAAGTVTIGAALGGFDTTKRYTVEPAAYGSATTSQKANLSYLADGDTNAISGSVSAVIG